jgi:undecaprenyl diphosphate synthase
LAAENKEWVERLRGIQLPQHVGVIMDGNGRWAQKRMLPRSAGHREGAEALGRIVRFVRDCAIPYITFYTFSTENWKRPADEVEQLMNLLHKFLGDTYKYKEENIRVCFLGDPSRLRPDLQRDMKKLEEESRGNTGLTVNIALNYGGRDEIVRAARSLCREAAAGRLRPEDLDEERFAGALDTAGMPECDVVLRPSGEQRISNFLLWQAAYAEFIFMDTLWPDFTEKDFAEAMLEYARRNRRFGGV